MRIELIAHVWLIERKKHLRISGRKFSVMIFKDGTDDEDKYAAHEAVVGTSMSFRFHFGCPKITG